jgi:hypothetical protein
MSDEPKRRRWSRAWIWWAAIALLLIAGIAFFMFAFTAAENGGGYFSNGHDSPPNQPARH